MWWVCCRLCRRVVTGECVVDSVLTGKCVVDSSGPATSGQGRG